MKKINIYQINLRQNKVEGPQFINIDFIQNKIDKLNSMLEIETPSDPKTNFKDFKSFQTPKITKYSNLLNYKNNTKTLNTEKTFKIKLMSLNNFFYDSEVLLIFDGYNVYKYVEKKEEK